MTTEQEKIVISGVGVVSPLGIGKRQVWESLGKGESFIKPLKLFDTSNLRSKLGGEISDFKPEEILGAQGIRNYDRTTCLAVSAAKLALDDAGFSISENNSTDVGVVLGSALGSLKSISDMDRQSLQEGPRSLDPGRCPNVVLCGPASQISIRLGVRGFTATISSGFQSSFCALQYALQMLEAGVVRHILVGAVEELCEPLFKGFCRLGSLSGSSDAGSELNAPFDSRRNGFILGEGAAIFFLEKKRDAQARQKRAYAEVSAFQEQPLQASVQYGQRNTFRHLESIIQDRSIEANPLFSDVDFVSLGGNSSVLGDALEAKAFMRIFSKKGRVPMAAAIKSMVGESYSAGGCFQLLGALYAIEQSSVFPTVGYKSGDLRCPAPFLSTMSVSREINKALVWSLGYGRSNYYATFNKLGEGVV